MIIAVAGGGDFTAARFLRCDLAELCGIGMLDPLLGLVRLSDVAGNVFEPGLLNVLVEVQIGRCQTN